MVGFINCKGICRFPWYLCIQRCPRTAFSGSHLVGFAVHLATSQRWKDGMARKTTQNPSSQKGRGKHCDTLAPGNIECVVCFCWEGWYLEVWISFQALSCKVKFDDDDGDDDDDDLVRAIPKSSKEVKVMTNGSSHWPNINLLWWLRHPERSLPGMCKNKAFG